MRKKDDCVKYLGDPAFSEFYRETFDQVKSLKLKYKTEKIEEREATRGNLYGGAKP